MALSDYLKALAGGAVVLALDVLIAIGVVYVYLLLTHPEHPNALVIPIARWSTRTAGTGLIFGAAWFFAKRRRDRNPYLFAIALTVFYALLDGASVGFTGVIATSFALTIGLKLIGALSGAWVSSKTRSP